MNSQSENETYKLVFRGVLAKGVDAKSAKRNIGQLFKIDAKKVDAMFSGKPTVLKRQLTLDVANKYRVAIKKAGALVDVELQQAAPAKATYTLPSEPQAEKVPGAIPGTEASVTEQAASTEQAEEGFQLAPVGADLLEFSEKRKVQPRELDTSSLSLKEQSGNLLNADEYEIVEGLTLDFDGLNLAEPGADVLRPEERKNPKVQQVDTSALSLAKPGATLAPAKPSPPPAPDVSKIKLVDES